MALHSMTGFASAELKQKSLIARAELRSVNHRFLDVAFRVPAALNVLESDALKVIRDELHRGRLEVGLSLSKSADDSAPVQFDSESFSQLWKAAEEAMQLSNATSEEARAATLAALLSRRELFEAPGADELSTDEIEILLKCLGQALSTLKSMRLEEGKALKKDLESQLKQLKKLVTAVEKESKVLPAQFEERLSSRLGRLTKSVEVEPDRLAAEVAILADKVDISEEIVRLESHLEQLAKLFDESPSGRKMEFLLQELGREFNTCASKAQSSAISQQVVEAKAVLEKMREQAQNVE